MPEQTRDLSRTAERLSLVERMSPEEKTAVLQYLIGYSPDGFDLGVSLIPRLHPVPAALTDTTP